MNSLQWRIKNFPEGGANSQSRCANLLFCIFFLKTAWKWNNLDPEVGGGRPWRLIGSANGLNWYSSNFDLNCQMSPVILFQINSDKHFIPDKGRW